MKTMNTIFIIFCLSFNLYAVECLYDDSQNLINDTAMELNNNVTQVLSLNRSQEQRLPECYRLSHLWINQFYSKLNPYIAENKKLPLTTLACDKPQSSWTFNEKMSYQLAKAAYVLDKTIFNRSSLPSTPLVSYGRIQSPPDSMLDWVAKRMKKLVIHESVGVPHASAETKTVYLTIDDLGFNNLATDIGLGLSGQLVHESRHIGYPSYGHVQCERSSGYNCDPAISEEFDGGGSHGVAVLWMAWLAKKSKCPKAEREKLDPVIDWVLQHRINGNLTTRNNFALRYLGRPIRPN